MLKGRKNQRPELSSRGRSRGKPRRRLRWPRLRLTRAFVPLTDWLYDLCFPMSRRSRQYYGYSGPSRQNRVTWLWRRLKQWVRGSLAGRALYAAKDRWYRWWHPVSGDFYRGKVQINRLDRDLRRLRRFLRGLPVVRAAGRAWASLKGRLYEWYYPRPGKVAAYSYPAQRHGRIALAWHAGRRRIASSAIGRKCRASAEALYEWYFPLVKNAGYGYAGYGYVSGHRMNRPEQFVRRNIRRFRRTWLGRKWSWMLDEIEDFITGVSRSAARVFAWERIERWLWRWQTYVILLGLVAMADMGNRYGVPFYRQSMARLYTGQARQYAAKGDFPRAMLRARQVLSLDSDNPVAIRVVADIADNSGSPFALAWRQRLVDLNPDAANYLSLARTALRIEAHPFSTAARALEKIAPADRESSAFHVVAGTLAIKLGDLPAAAQHYEEALRQNPDDPASRMSLAVVRLQAGDPKAIEDSRSALELLRTDQQLGVLAARSLVAESIDRHEFDRAVKLSEELLASKKGAFSDRIVFLAILNAQKSPRLEAFLDETKKLAEENPYYVGELASWMNRSGFAQAVLDWIGGLPAGLTGQGLVPLVVADSHLALGQWKELRDFLTKERWGGLDAVRLGMLSLASRQLSDTDAYLDYWRQAIRAGSESPGTLKSLAEIAAGWGWKEETEAVLWLAAGKFPSASGPLTTLQNLYTGQQNTDGLRRVFDAQVTRDPKDALARNNYAMVSLLLGVDLERAFRYASEVHLSDPANPVFASTYAFSLFVQGRAREAVRTLAALGLDKLDDPALAAYYGVFLSAAGDTMTGRNYLEKSSKAFLLPEERELVDRANKAL